MANHGERRDGILQTNSAAPLMTQKRSLIGWKIN
jgi:hypothetical protein